MTKSLTLLLASAWLAIAATPDQDIRRVLDDQVAAWNRGDIAAFAQGYLDSPDILFVGHDITRGHAGMLEHYRKTYPTPDKMGKLTFTIVEVKVLDTHYANVVGRFHLDRAPALAGKDDGVFTLLFQNTPHGWKIIQDHTS